MIDHFLRTGAVVLVRTDGTSHRIQIVDHGKRIVRMAAQTMHFQIFVVAVPATVGTLECSQYAEHERPTGELDVFAGDLWEFVVVLPVLVDD